MVTVYLAPKTQFASSEEFVFSVLQKKPLKTERGKPYLTDGRYISLSHTDESYFLAVSDTEVGIDAETTDRTVDLPLLANKYFPERPDLTRKEFLSAWTKKESAAKLFGFGLSGIKTLALDGEQIVCKTHSRRVYLKTELLLGHFVSVASFSPQSVSYINL